MEEIKWQHKNIQIIQKKGKEIKKSQRTDRTNRKQIAIWLSKSNHVKEKERMDNQILNYI